jgi:peptide/nickel transport system permease protein
MEAASATADTSKLLTGSRDWWRRWRGDHPILAMVVRRSAAGILTLFFVSVLIFFALNVLPGNVATVILGRNATPEAVERIERDLQLDKPLTERYARFATGIATGDLGNSSVAVARNDPKPSVSGIINRPLLNSLVLASLAIALVIPLALLLGAWSAVRAGSPSDHVVSWVSLAFSSMPEFLTGTIFVFVFFTVLDVLPPISTIPPGSGPFDRPEILILPVLTLLAVSLAYTTRLVRATTIETLRQDYVMMARLNGYKEGRIIWRYALRNALPPSVQSIALTLQYLIGGIIVVESVFNYPGIGSVLVNAVFTRDVQLVGVISIILAATYITINIIADVVVVLLVPKLRTGSA